MRTLFLKRPDKVIALLALLIYASPLAAAAALVPEACLAGGSGCTICHLGILTINITNFLMKNVAFPATILLVAVGGIMLLISGPSEERRTMGKKILTSTVTGLLIIMLAWLGVDTLIKVLTGSFKFGGEPGSLFTNFKSSAGNFGPWSRLPIEKCGIQ